MTATRRFNLPKSQCLKVFRLRGRIIGKVLVVNGARVLFRRYDSSVAVFRKDDSLSFDEALLKAAQRWACRSIHYVWGNTLYLVETHRFAADAEHGNYGEGNQLYLALHRWRNMPLYYQESYSEDIEDLDAPLAAQPPNVGSLLPVPSAPLDPDAIGARSEEEGGEEYRIAALNHPLPEPDEPGGPTMGRQGVRKNGLIYREGVCPRHKRKTSAFMYANENGWVFRCKEGHAFAVPPDDGSAPAKAPRKRGA